MDNTQLRHKDIVGMAAVRRQWINTVALRHFCGAGLTKLESCHDTVRSQKSNGEEETAYSGGDGSTMSMYHIEA